jgi:hypothetical protein
MVVILRGLIKGKDVASLKKKYLSSTPYKYGWISRPEKKKIWCKVFSLPNFFSYRQFCLFPLSPL